MSDNNIIRFDGVSKRYDDGTQVLEHIDFEIERGKFYTLLGPSGCGKNDHFAHDRWFYGAKRRRYSF